MLNNTGVMQRFNALDSSILLAPLYKAIYCENPKTLKLFLNNEYVKEAIDNSQDHVGFVNGLFLDVKMILEKLEKSDANPDQKKCAIAVLESNPIKERLIKLASEWKEQLKLEFDNDKENCATLATIIEKFKAFGESQANSQSEQVGLEAVASVKSK